MLFFESFRLFKQTLNLLQQINVKNVHPVYEPTTFGTQVSSHNH